MSTALSWPPRGETSLRLRDREAFAALARFRCLSAQQMAALTLRDGTLAPASREPVARRVLQRIRARGLITTRAALADFCDHPVQVHFLTTSGRQAYGYRDPRYPVARLRTPGLSSLAHSLLLTDIAITIQQAIDQVAGARMGWECDWETVARLGSALAIPDALLTYDIEHRRVFAFVEADRATERGPAFGRKVERYLALYRSDIWRKSLPVWPLVLTVTTTAGHAEYLAVCADDAVKRRGETHLASRFRFTSFEELRGPVGLFGAIWRVAGRADVHPPLDTPLGVRGRATEGEQDG